MVEELDLARVEHELHFGSGVCRARGVEARDDRCAASGRLVDAERSLGDPARARVDGRQRAGLRVVSEEVRDVVVDVVDAARVDEVGDPLVVTGR